MAGFVVKTDNQTVLAGLDETRAAVADYGAMLSIAGELMRGSVAKTFRAEGSPAGSWPRLAASTMKKKGYTAGHKLLILSGRLFGSISYVVSGNTLTVGTNVVYAGVHQYGSADRRGGSIGPQAKLKDRADKRGRHQNIPARPFLVFRPEDPGRIMEGFEAYLSGKMHRVGRVISTKNASGDDIFMQGVTFGDQS
jgi:phage virion morphogenesis protein